MASASEYIGEVYSLSRGGTAIVGQMDFDWAFTIPHYFPVGGDYTEFGVSYHDNDSDTYHRLNGAWGSWNGSETIPNIVDLRSYAANAGSYLPIYDRTGWSWNQIDDGLMVGSGQFSDLDEWNEVVDLIDSSVCWIWGNLRDGGCGFLKYDSSNVFPIFSTGTYENESGAQKIAAGSYNAEPISSWYDGCLGVFYNVGRNSYSNICYIKGNTQPYIATDPTQSLGNINWMSGSYGSMSDTLDNSSSAFGDGLVKNTLVSMNSITSPYGGLITIYDPSVTIADSGYELVTIGPDSGIVDKMNAGGNAGDNDGDGDFDNSSDEIDFPDDSQFAIDAQSSGFVTVFKPSKETIQDFAAWLYGTLPTTYGSWLDNISKLQKNPMDAIISLNMAHYDATSGGSEPLNFFGQASGYTAPVVSHITNILDCGSVTINEYSGNFLDYGGKSTIKIFIPYCTIATLSTNEVMGAELHLKYYIDILSGACIAQLKVIRQRSRVYADPNMSAIIYTFTGNIFQQIPITAVDYSNIMRGQLNLAAGAASIATGNLAGGISSIVNTAMSMSPSAERVGNYGSSYGYMGYQKPFVIQEYPWYNFPSKYDNYYGRPLYDYKKLNYCDGYTEVDPGTLWTDKFDWITSEEEEMLRQITDSGGIFIDHTSAYYNYDPEA